MINQLSFIQVLYCPRTAYSLLEWCEWFKRIRGSSLHTVQHKTSWWVVFQVCCWHWGDSS